jgi:hypothetical protein
MDKEYKITDVTYNDEFKTLRVDVDNIGVMASFCTYKNTELPGGFGFIFLEDIPLDEVISLRDKLSKVIDSEVSKINTEINGPSQITTELAEVIDGLLSGR